MPEAASTLAKLEAELAATIRERSDELGHLVAVALVEIAVSERAARNGDGRAAGARLCTICRGRLAAPARTICHSCRGRMRREQERLRQERAREVEAARNGERGELARQFATGERVAVTRAVNT